MPRPTDSGRVDLNQVFLHLQSRMLSHLEVGSALEHASTCGAAIYAIVEVKQVLTRQYVRDAGLKIGSVRRLRRTSVPVPFAGGSYPPKRPHRILGVVAATRSVWVKDFEQNLTSALAQLNSNEAIDLGCVVTQGAFETSSHGLRLSDPSESPIYLMIRLIERLRALGNATAADLTSYGRTLKSFR